MPDCWFKKSLVFVIIIILISVVLMPIFNAKTNALESNFAEEIIGNEIVINKKIPRVETADNQGNVLISAFNLDGDDIYPKITRNEDETLVVSYESYLKNEENAAPIAYSNNYGETWIEQFLIPPVLPDYIEIVSPDITYCPTTDELFWTALSHEPPLKYLSRIPSNLSTVDEIYIEYLSFGPPNWISIPRAYEAVCGYVEENYLLFHIADLEKFYAYPDYHRCLGLDYYSPEWGPIDKDWSWTGYFDAETKLDTAPAYNPAIATGDDFFYVVVQHENETTGKDQIVYKAFSIEHYKELGGCPNPWSPGDEGNLYSDIEFTPWQFYLANEAVDPDVTASGNNVCIVYSQHDGIRCNYSYNDGASWNTSIVAKNAAFPCVYMKDKHVFCAYVQDGNVYKIESLDGGATWGNPIRLNDIDGTVAEEYGSVDMIDLGVVWTDERNGAKDIYFANESKLIIKNLKGQFGSVSAVVENIGTAIASNIQWEINIDGMIFTGGHSEGSIAFLPAGSETTISTINLIFGIGPATITIIAGEILKTTDCIIFGPFIFGLDYQK